MNHSLGSLFLIYVLSQRLSKLKKMMKMKMKLKEKKENQKSEMVMLMILIYKSYPKNRLTIQIILNNQLLY